MKISDPSTEIPSAARVSPASSPDLATTRKKCVPSARMVLMGQVTCVLLLLLPIVGYNMWSEARFASGVQVLQLQRLVQSLASRQVTLASSTESLLLSMSLAPVVQNGESDPMLAYLSSVDRNQPDFDGFAVFNNKGETVAGLYDGRPRQLPAETVRSRGYFAESLRNRGFHISQALTLENGRTILPMLMPIANTEGAVSGLVMASLSMTRHQSLMEGLLAGDETSVFLFDGAHERIFSFIPDDGLGDTLLKSLSMNEFLPRTAPLFKEGAPFPGGSFRLIDPKTGRRYVGSSTTLCVGEDAPYMTIVGLTEEVQMWQFLLQRFQWEMIATGLVLLLVLYLSSRLGARYFVRGLELLSGVAHRTRNGDLTVRCGSVPGCREIVDLSLTVDAMMAALEEKNAELRRLAVMDPLTGLWNRRHFSEVAQQELALAARQGYAMSVVMADIDHFKRVNDTYGHASGDLVLQHFTAALRENLRVSDILARYGGEEFIMLLPATDSAGAQIVLEKLRRVTEALRVSLPDGQEVRFTASFGVASEIPVHNISENALLTALQARADAALYVSKESGRNRVTAG